jgi:hypothetical protein
MDVVIVALISCLLDTRSVISISDLTELTQLAIKPSAEWYFVFFCVSAFALYERKNPGAPWAYR